jgi:TPR repeat protein
VISAHHTLTGTMYANGWGVPRDYAEALRWYRKAADQGDANAQGNLGTMYARCKAIAITGYQRNLCVFFFSLLPRG